MQHYTKPPPPRSLCFYNHAHSQSTRLCFPSTTQILFEGNIIVALICFTGNLFFSSPNLWNVTFFLRHHQRWEECRARAKKKSSDTRDRNWSCSFHVLLSLGCYVNDHVKEGSWFWQKFKNINTSHLMLHIELKREREQHWNNVRSQFLSFP